MWGWILLAVVLLLLFIGLLFWLTSPGYGPNTNALWVFSVTSPVDLTPIPTNGNLTQLYLHKNGTFTLSTTPQLQGTWSLVGPRSVNGVQGVQLTLPVQQGGPAADIGFTGAYQVINKTDYMSGGIVNLATGALIMGSWAASTGNIPPF